MANFGGKSEKMAGGKCACAQVLPPNFAVPDVLRKVEADYLGWKEDSTT